MPESDIKVVTHSVFMVGRESRSVMASAKFLLSPEHAGNKTNITVVQTTTVMFINIRCEFRFFTTDIII